MAVTSSVASATRVQKKESWGRNRNVDILANVSAGDTPSVAPGAVNKWVSK